MEEADVMIPPVEIEDAIFYSQVGCEQNQAIGMGSKQNVLCSKG